MNIRLSCYASRKNGKNCWIVETNGEVIKSGLFKFQGDNIKENAISCVEKGLRALRNSVLHDDCIHIEIQNVHLAEWLSGQKEYSTYAHQLGRVFAVLEDLDCKYNFYFEKTPRAKRYGETHDIPKISLQPLENLFDMEVADE